MNTITEELSAFGFDNVSRITLSRELNESSYGKLKNLFTNVCDDANALTDNDRVNRMIIHYAIVGAIETNQDYLTSGMLEVAKTKADSLAGILGTLQIQEENELEDGDESSESVRKGVKRTRNPDLFPRIKNLVGLHPEEDRDQIVARVIKEFDTNENTATMYFYKARKELGLKNNGKRGRKKSIK